MSNKRIRKKLAKRGGLGAQIIQGLREALAIERGELDPPRVVIFEQAADGTTVRREFTGPEWRAWERQQKDRESAP